MGWRSVGGTNQGLEATDKGDNGDGRSAFPQSLNGVTNLMLS